MKLEEHEFGRLRDSSEVKLVRAVAAEGLEVSVISYGATLASVRAPSKNGPPEEITLGFDSIDGYLAKHPYFGATVGRYANRIEGASFVLNGKSYRLSANSDPNHLHGGIVGFNRVSWNTTISASPTEARISFTHISPDGHEGYPGNLKTTVTYVVQDDNVIRIEYEAETDAETPINLTNHTYWNLDRPGTDVRDHLMTLSASRYLAINEDFIPTGEILQVARTPFDFRSEKRISDDFDRAGGYDHNYVIDGTPGRLRKAAVVRSTRTGRRMSVYTDQAAMQFYTATHMIDDIPGRDGVVFSRYGALCVETGAYNNSVNIASFPSTILAPGEKYSHICEHRFEID